MAAPLPTIPAPSPQRRRRRALVFAVAAIVLVVAIAIAVVWAVGQAATAQPPGPGTRVVASDLSAATDAASHESEGTPEHAAAQYLSEQPTMYWLLPEADPVDVVAERIGHLADDQLSVDGRLLTVNDSYARLYGLDPLDPLLPAASVEYTARRGMPVPLSERPFVRAARGETFTDASIWLFTREGEWRALSITAKRLGASGDEAPTILLLVHDVTAIAEAQREREQITAMASHELKHPLTVMIGNAELALEVDTLEPRTRQRFEAIVNASERMLTMTNSMLTLSRKGLTGREDVEDIDLRQILVESVQSFRPTAVAHEVHLDLRIDEPLPVVADSFRLRQVVDNIVSNAIKYTPRDGRVHVIGSVGSDSVSLTVRDTGIGIAADDLRKIMTPYFRTAEAKQKAGGTGLGLGISHEIVSAHGGSLTIDSEAGVGTTVAVHLPRSSDSGRGTPARALI